MDDSILYRYEQAQALMQCQFQHSSPIVNNDVVLPRWVKNSHCFWYIRQTKSGKQYRLIDAETAENREAFDHKVLANALSMLVKQHVDDKNLPIRDVVLSLSPNKIRFTAFKKFWLFDLDEASCYETENYLQQEWSAYGNNPQFSPLNFLNQQQQYLTSPNGKQAVYVSNYNLWLRDNVTREEIALTHDGSADYFYGSGPYDNAVPAQWSPDSRSLLTALWDARNVERRNIIQYIPEDGRMLPMEASYKHMAQSGADCIETWKLVVVEINTGELQTPDYPEMPHFTLGERFTGLFRSNMAWWSADGRRVIFIDLSRGCKVARVVEWDTHTNVTRILLEECSQTYINLRHGVNDPPLILPLPESNELIWFSERSDWGHLYLYDLSTGELKNPVTEGQWLVRNILHYDSERRELLLHTASRDSSISPYYRDIAKVNIDTGEMSTLASGDYDYNVCQYLNFWTFAETTYSTIGYSIDELVHGLSPCGKYIVYTRSRVDCIPESVLIDRNGSEILIVEVADVSGLPDNWCWPEPVTLKSADETTNIYGVVFRPPGFSSDKRYPVVEYCSSGRQIDAMPQGSFDNGTYNGLVYYHGIALAALGFIAVVIEGRGTPLRNKAFRDHHFGDFYYAGDFDDRIAGMRQLAQRYSSMDLNRVGIVSTENMTNSVYALLKHSNFYKVAVLHCYYDPRFGYVRWNEAADGMLDNVTTSYPEDCVKTFGGKILLIQGMLSSLAGATFRLVDALQKANKTFDMLCLPEMSNSMTSYTIRREWDYLVEHLYGTEPPSDFHLETIEERVETSPEFYEPMMVETSKFFSEKCD